MKFRWRGKGCVSAEHLLHDAVMGQGPARAIPALTVGEVKHTVALATLWASPSGRGWFRTGLDT